MRTRHRFLRFSMLACAAALLGACSNEVQVSPTSAGESAPAAAAAEVGASPEVQKLVAEIDGMLAVPQDRYPDGNAYSAVFEELLGAVQRQDRSLRTTQVAQNMGYFIAHGHGIGWDPKEADVARLARDWKEFRGTVLAGP